MLAASMLMSCTDASSTDGSDSGRDVSTASPTAETTAQEGSAAVGPGDDEDALWGHCPRSGLVPADAERLSDLDLDDDGAAETTLWLSRITPTHRLLATVSNEVVSDVAAGPLLFAPSVLSTVDLDGDGSKEVFVGGIGNTGRSAMVLTRSDCALQPARSATEDPFLLLIGVGGNSCAPTGCPVGNRCEPTDSGLLLVHVEVEPVGGGAGTTVVDPPVTMRSTNYRLTEGSMTAVVNTVDTFSSMDKLPNHYPSMADSDTIDC
jgi:hypothetical protein